MSTIRYDAGQLHKLRESPLVRKPDGLPSIAQWMEPAPQENGRRKQQPGRGDELLPNQDGTAVRPLLPTRHSARISNSEDVVLGPPKPAFTSSRNTNKVPDGHDKGVDKYNSTTFGDDGPNTDRTPGIRDRFNFRDRDGDRPVRERNIAPGSRRSGREEEGGGWATVSRARRGSQHEDAEKGDRWQRLANDRNKEADSLEDTSRRNGAGRGRFERTWQREEQQGDGDGTRPAGNSWRDRNRERERDREWTRGGRVQDRVEEDPEWMDTPAKEEKLQGRTAEDFQRWKEKMKAGKTPGDAKEEVVQSSQLDVTDNANPPKLTPVTLNIGEGMFNMWGAEKKVDPKLIEETVTKPQVSKNKSRFVGLFQKEDTPPAEPEIPPPSAVDSNGIKSREDQEGFQRILSLLSSSNRGAQPQRPVEVPSKMGGSRMSLTDQELKQEQPPVSSRPDSAGIISDLLARHANSGRSRGPQTAPLESERATQYFPNPSGDYGRMPNGREENTTPRTGGGMFSPPVPADPSAGHGPPLSRDREFLLTLIQNKRAQPQESLQRSAEPSDFPQFHLSQQRKQPQNQHEIPQRMAPSAPPGLYDGPFPRRELEPEMHPLRKTASRPQPQGTPSSFYDYPDESAMGGMSGLQRRNTTEQRQQQHPPMSNMGIPSQQAPTDPFRMGLGPQGMPPPPNAQEQRPSHMAPPPGFDPRPRPPPGFQQGLPPQMQQHQVNPALGHPGMGRDPRMGGPVGMFPGMPPPGPLPPPQGQMGPPPGYFAGQPPQGMSGPPPGFSQREFIMMQQAQAQAHAQAQGRGFPPEDMGRGRGGMPPGFM